jgi:hypothetical protein
MRSLFLITALPVLIAASPATVEGRYALTGMREAAGGLELRPDGWFSYGFSYGALDEQAEGKWRLEGGRVLLTTDPAPRPPEWRLAEASAGDPALFRLKLETPDGKPIANIEVTAIMEQGADEKTQTTQDWLEAPLSSQHVPKAIRFHIPVFDVESPVFPIDIKAAHSFRFVLDAKDLGVRDFRDWPLEIRGDILAPPEARPGEGFRRVDGGD